MTTPTQSPFRFVNRWRYLVLKLDISANAANLLQVLLCYTDHGDGGDCWPSVKRLSKGTKLHERTVQRTLRELETLRIIRAVSRPMSTNIYEFCDPDDVEQRLAFKDMDADIQASRRTMLKHITFSITRYRC